MFLVKEFAFPLYQWPTHVKIKKIRTQGFYIKLVRKAGLRNKREVSGNE